MDAQLKGGSKSQTDEELEADLDRALMLFRYISVSSRSLPVPSRCALNAPLTLLLMLAVLALYASTGLFCLQSLSVQSFTAVVSRIPADLHETWGHLPHLVVPEICPGSSCMMITLQAWALGNPQISR